MKFMPVIAVTNKEPGITILERGFARTIGIQTGRDCKRIAGIASDKHNFPRIRCGRVRKRRVSGHHKKIDPRPGREIGIRRCLRERRGTLRTERKTGSPYQLGGCISGKHGDRSFRMYGASRIICINLQTYSSAARRFKIGSATSQ